MSTEMLSTSQASLMSTFIFLFTTAQVVLAQQFAEAPLPPNWPGISTSCMNALNTTVNCRGILSVFAEDYPRFNTTSAGSICTMPCLTSLKSVRQTIVNGCNNATTDVIKFWNGNTYPATYLIDRFLYMYNLGCLKDKTTGRYCDPQFISWLSRDGTLTAAQNCSDCNLASQQLQLNSPFGYDDGFATNFKALTSSCSKTGYDFTKPASYALTTGASTISTTAAPSATPVCLTPYTVQANDTCDSIAAAFNVPTIAVISAGGFDITCKDIKAGVQMCLGLRCTTYQVQVEDTCDSILSSVGSGMTKTQFLSWNPNINPSCRNLYDWVYSYVCISNPGGPVGVVTQSTPLAVSTPTSPVPKPTNAPNESNSRCGYWYTVQEGDYCDKLSVQFHITLKDFYFLNPQINSECTNLLLGLAYCVEAIGDIETYSGYPATSSYYTLTSETFTTSPATSATWTPGPMTTTPTLPRASGTRNNCAFYRNYIDVPPVVDQAALLYQYGDTYYSPITNYINACDFISRTYGSTINDLLNWNPSLSNSSCALKSGFSYCVYNGVDADPDDDDAGCVDPGNNKHPNTITTCSCFTIVYGFQKPYLSCQQIADRSEITVSQILQWNPWIGSDCDTGIYSGLNNTDTSYNYVCKGVDAATTTSTARNKASPSTPTPTKTR